MYRLSRRIALVIPGFCLMALSPFALAVSPDEIQKLIPSRGHIGDLAGWRVAIDGDTIVLGTRGDQEAARRAGAAHVFERNVAAVACPVTGTIDPWCEVAKLLPTDAPSGTVEEQRMGNHVAVSGDTIIVGAFRDQTTAFRAGSAHVYTRVGGTWTYQQNIAPADVAANDHFSTSIVIDGNKAYLGSGSGVSGAIYEFTRTEGVWSETDKIMPDTPVPGQNFGGAVSVHGDTMLVAAGWEDTAAGAQTGAAYVFVRSGGGWTQQARLEPSDPTPFARFGVGVSVYGDTAIIGSPYDSDIVSQSGSAYVFTRSGSTWTERLKIPSPGNGQDDFFGFVVRLSGNTAIIPSDLEDSPLVDAGAVYFFTGAGDNWTQQARLVPSDALGGDAFGWGVDVDGDDVVVGAPTTIFNFQGRQGVAYVYDLRRGDTETGTDVKVTPLPVDENGEPDADAPVIEISFDEVTVSGETTVTVTEGGPPPPAGFEIEGVQGRALYLNIESTAIFEGEVEICIDYSDMNVNNPDKLAFLHYEDPDGDGVGEWVDATSSHDAENKILCARVTSFSFFALVEVLPLDQLLQALLDAIDAAPKDEDGESKLVERAEDILKSLDKGDIGEAIEELERLHDDIQAALAGNTISDAEAETLSALADLLIDSLSELIPP